MCKKTNYKTPNTRLDKCMRPIIQWLKNKHIPVACCCGHGKYPITIVVKEGRNGKIVYVEIFSQIIIPRTKRFYKRDKQGYYYIPETI